MSSTMSVREGDSKRSMKSSGTKEGEATGGEPSIEKRSIASSAGTRNQYRDYSHILPDEADLAESSAASRFSPETPPSILRIQKLPTKLEVILDNPDFAPIVSWMDHGRSWKVHQPKLFLEKVIPLYFEYSNYNSFIRLVNAWGFRRMSRGKDRNSYFHELFLRGMPHLHKRMKRLTAKEKKEPLSPEDEPDFDAIAKTHPLKPVFPKAAAPGGPTKGAASSATNGGSPAPKRRKTNVMSQPPKNGGNLTVPCSTLQLEHPKPPQSPAKKAQEQQNAREDFMSQQQHVGQRAQPQQHVGQRAEPQQQQAAGEAVVDTSQMRALSEAVQLIRRQQEEQELNSQVSQLEQLQKQISDLQQSIATKQRALMVAGGGDPGAVAMGGGGGTASPLNGEKVVVSPTHLLECQTSSSQVSQAYHHRQPHPHHRPHGPGMVLTPTMSPATSITMGTSPSPTMMYPGHHHPHAQVVGVIPASLRMQPLTGGHHLSLHGNRGMMHHSHHMGGAMGQPGPGQNAPPSQMAGQLVHQAQHLIRKHGANGAYGGPGGHPYGVMPHGGISNGQMHRQQTAVQLLSAAVNLLGNEHVAVSAPGGGSGGGMQYHGQAGDGFPGDFPMQPAAPFPGDEDHKHHQ